MVNCYINRLEVEMLRSLGGTQTLAGHAIGGQAEACEITNSIYYYDAIDFEIPIK